jgi:hypothetical protein
MWERRMAQPLAGLEVWDLMLLWVEKQVLTWRMLLPERALVQDRTSPLPARAAAWAAALVAFSLQG